MLHLTHPMMLMRRLSIRLRMNLAVGLVTVLLVLVGGLGVAGMFRVQSLGTALLDTSLSTMTALNSVREVMAKVQRLEKDMIINYEKPDDLVVIHKQWTQSLADADKRMADLRQATGTSEESEARLKRLDELLKSYPEAFAPIAKQLLMNGYDTATVANRLAGKAHAVFADAEKQVAVIDAAVLEEVAQTRESTEASTRSTFLTFVAGVLVIVGVMVPLALINSISICNPLLAAKEVAQRIAGGDLTSEIKSDGSDETAHLLAALSEMQVSLRGMARQLQSSGESVSIAAAEIATGTMDLSSRTEQAAASLQKTAVSMQELTATVRESSQSSQHASRLARSAAGVAMQGGEVVDKVVNTMDRINSDSKRISDIVGVIDDIAFQTNILALNAAVESARAGEQGRGFAVVATEVRGLAQRSAQAAREIKSLIGSSVLKVEEGAALVRDAGSTMQSILTSVHNVVGIVDEMAANAAKQDAGMAMISQAVTQLDHMTQQNAALVEESAAASESLKDQAAALISVVDGFKLPAPLDDAATGTDAQAEHLQATA